MASGSFGISSSNGYIKGTLSWSSSPDTANNRSYVTATLRLSRTNSGYTTYGSGTFYVKINGQTFSDSGSYTITYNSNTVMVSASTYVQHNSDGKKEITISTWGSISGVLSVSTQSGKATLDNIARASTLASNADWTAGNNKYLSINRASSSFTHTVKMYVNGSLVKTANNVGASVTMSFNTTENTAVFDRLNGATSEDTKIEVLTYYNGDYIGTTSKTGTVTAPLNSYTTLDNPTGVSEASGQGHNTMYIDQTIDITIHRENSGFTHRLDFRIGNSGAIVHSVTGVGASYSWTPSASQMQQLYAASANNIEIDGQLEVYTYYNGEPVRGVWNRDINYRVRNSNPTFTTGVNYRDTNSLTTGVTGNNQYIVQGVSNVLVEIPVANRAVARNGASMVEYVAKLAGETITKPYSSTATVTFDFGTISAGSNQTLQVDAVDSRGNKTTISKSVLVAAYSPPSASVSAERLNNFEAQTDLNVTGNISGISVGGTLKNNLTSIYYEYKLSSATSYPTTGNGARSDLTLKTGIALPAFATQEVSPILDNLKSWDVRVSISDRLTSTSHVVTVPVGRPIFFIDTEKGSIGFNDFPVNNEEFRINGRLVFGSNQWANSTGHGETAGGALDLNNSDITRVNGIFFNDVANNNGEGLLFLKSGKPEGSGANADYDNFRISDGTAILNSQNVFGNHSEGGHGIYTTRLELASNVYADDAFGPGLNLNNSDIVGANQIFFNDTTAQDTEGIQWPHSSTPAGSRDSAQYDTFRIYNKTGYLNSKPIFTVDDEILWSGGAYMHETQYAEPSKRMSQCPNGWVLVWSEYNGGSLQSGWQFTYVPKKYATLSSGGAWMPVYGNGGTPALKYIYCTDTRVNGHARNNDNPQDQIVLRYVLSF